MNSLPEELYRVIFGYLTSKNRSELCSVSKLFDLNLQRVSCISKYSENTKFTKTDIIDIYKEHNYHLIVRLKYDSFINFEDVCKFGDIDLVELIVDKYLCIKGYHLAIFTWCHGLGSACEGGNLPIVELILKKEGVFIMQHVLITACSLGDTTIINLLIENGVKNLKYGFYTACYHGCEPAVNLMIKKGVSKWNKGLYCACQGGRKSIIQLMIKNGATVCNNCNKSIKDHE